MKIVISGGLGNQMFQYAFYLAFLEKLKNISIDTCLYSSYQIHNGFELERCFGIMKPYVTSKKWNIFKLRAAMKIKVYPIVHYDPEYYENDIFNKKCLYFYGYWQSEKYFKIIENKIRSIFTFINIDDINKNMAAEIRSNVSVSVHIRRGDYLGNKRYSNVCTNEYYKNAINLILDKIGVNNKILFYIFSDDMKYSEEFIKKFNIQYKLVNINSNEDSYKDMYLMSNCDHNIIANSSFSWWGAWLNKNANKIIVAPNKWFNECSSEKYKDIIPEDWIKL
ncbi:alpha-1,2-fucosyltransferase [uncultured Chryseobacterium sp.]|uniref:alpha-1,2-fucosyltransferase n=1 Tax=uncultured Chryseobacterium sp. TaxID=259322 RepID=UPI0025CD4661|nr:alpha-1,2-fucosyltransferase [uncultured Chryseobacterium sp.]